MLEGGVYCGPFLAPMVLGGDWDGVMLEGGVCWDPFLAPMVLGGDWDWVMLDGGFTGRLIGWVEGEEEK